MSDADAPDAEACADAGGDVRVAEPGWGATVGLFDSDGDADGAAGDAEGAASDGEPGWGASRGVVEASGVGPAFDALAQINDGIDVLLGLIDGQEIAVADIAEVTAKLFDADTRLRAAHAAALAQADRSGGLPAGQSAGSFVRDSHVLDFGRAATVAHNAAWLAEDGHDLIREAFRTAEVTADHVTAIRVVAAHSAARRETFLAMQAELVQVARNSDPKATARILKAWADVVDAADGDAESDKAWDKRGVSLVQIGDAWKLSGSLPAAEGAELAGLLNAFAELRRRKNEPGAGSDPDAAEPDPPSATQARADALMDIARTAAAADPELADGARQKARVTVVVPVDRLHHHTTDCDPKEGTDPSTDCAAHSDGAAGSHAAGDCDPGDVSDTDSEACGGEDVHVEDDGAGSCDGAGGCDGPADREAADAFGAADDNSDGDTSVVIDLRDSPRPSTRLSADGVADVPNVPGAPVGPGSALRASRIDHLKTHLGSRRPELFGAAWAVGNGPGQGFLAHTDALRLTCDGEITRLILGPQSQPLDIGRTTRVVPPKLRTALDIRDGGCAAPGCDRPPGWCEAHHIQHWAHGGKTALSNLLLLCSKHHHDLHRGWWTITTPPHSSTPVMHRSRGPDRRRAA